MPLSIESVLIKNQCRTIDEIYDSMKVIMRFGVISSQKQKVYKGGAEHSSMDQRGPLHRILVVHDNKEVRAFLKSRLEQGPFIVELKQNGKGAIDRITSDTYMPDAIILSLSLPVMDGFETLRQIRRANKRVPIIILSDREQEKEELEAFDSGANDFVTIPFSGDVLISRLHQHLEHGRRSPPTWSDRGMTDIESNSEL